MWTFYVKVLFFKLLTRKTTQNEQSIKKLEWIHRVAAIIFYANNFKCKQQLYSLQVTIKISRPKWNGLTFSSSVTNKCVYLHMFPLDEKLQKQKFTGDFGWKKLSKMLKNRDKTTKNDRNWNKKLRENLQFIHYLRRNSTVHITVK